MHNPLIVKNSITINAAPEKVWDALVNPEQTKKYMFGCETVSDWTPGSDLLWRGTYEGKEIIFVKGKILHLEPGSFLSYSTIDPNSGIADIPENYLTVTYTLTSQNVQTVLTVTQGDYTTVGDGEKRYRETIAGGGWDPVLTAIKKLVEETVSKESV